MTHRPDGTDTATDEFLTVAELATRLKLKAKTVRNRMYDGTWRKGVHWFAPRGISPRFRWSAIVRWLEAPEQEAVPGPGLAYGADIPLPRRVRRRRLDGVVASAVGAPRP